MSTVNDNALAVVEASTGEISPSHAQAMAKHEIEGAIVLARRFPRNEEAALQRILKSCGRISFAKLALYSYPRGGTTISGPSVNLAREMARCWGNIRYGCDIIQDDETTRTIRGWAWDLETNTKGHEEASFKKLIYRKKGGWDEPDERDLRELTNKHGAICVRNSILHILPADVIDDAKAETKKTMTRKFAADPDGAYKQMLRAFSSIRVSVDDLELYLGHPYRQCSTDELADIQSVWKSINDGNSKWQDYVKDKAAKPQSVEDFTGEPEEPEKTTTPPVQPEEAEARLDTIQSKVDDADHVCTGEPPTDGDLYFQEAIAQYRDTEWETLADIVKLDAATAKDDNLTDEQKWILLDGGDAPSESQQARDRIGGEA